MGPQKELLTHRYQGAWTWEWHVGPKTEELVENLYLKQSTYIYKTLELKIPLTNYLNPSHKKGKEGMKGMRERGLGSEEWEERGK